MNLDELGSPGKICLFYIVRCGYKKCNKWMIFDNPSGRTQNRRNNVKTKIIEDGWFHVDEGNGSVWYHSKECQEKSTGRAIISK